MGLKFQRQLLGCKRNEKDIENHSLFAKVGQSLFVSFIKLAIWADHSLYCSLFCLCPQMTTVPPQLPTTIQHNKGGSSGTFLSAIKNSTSLQSNSKFSFSLPWSSVKGIKITSPYCIRYHQKSVASFDFCKFRKSKANHKGFESAALIQWRLLQALGNWG